MRTRRVVGLTGVVAVAAGGGADAGHSLAVTRHGDTYAWGCDRWQQLGLGSAEAGAVGYTWEGGKLWQTAPRRVEALRGIVDVAAGADHSLALARDGQVYDILRARDQGENHPGPEFTGPCFSPDGSVLFVNVQRPLELTLAIRGPWPN